MPLNKTDQLGLKILTKFSHFYQLFSILQISHFEDASVIHMQIYFKQIYELVYYTRDGFDDEELQHLVVPIFEQRFGLDHPEDQTIINIQDTGLPITRVQYSQITRQLMHNFGTAYRDNLGKSYLFCTELLSEIELMGMTNFKTDLHLKNKSGRDRAKKHIEMVYSDIMKFLAEYAKIF